MSDLDLSKPVRTMDGRAVEILATEGREPYPVVGYLGDDNSDVQCWTTAGEFECGTLCGLNLENIPQKRSGWVIFYPGSVDIHATEFVLRDTAENDPPGTFPTKQACQDYITTIGYAGVTPAYIEWEE